MKVTERVRRCVAFVGHDAGFGFSPFGTAFIGLVTRGNFGFTFLACASHVIDDIPGEIVRIRINTKSGGCDTVKIPKSDRIDSPKSSDITVFIASISFDSFSFSAVPLDREVLERLRNEFEKGECGEEVATIGLYTSHYGATKNIPVVRVGHIAMLPDEPIWTNRGYNKAYLIETRSIEGLSGSPVFLNVPPVRIKDGEHVLLKQEAYIPIGIMIGRHSVEERSGERILAPTNQGDDASVRPESVMKTFENTGLAVVTPIDVVLDIVESAAVIKKLDDIIDRTTKALNYSESGNDGDIHVATDDPA